MRLYLSIAVCCVSLSAGVQSLWNLQSLRPLTQSKGGLYTAVSSNGDVYIAGPPSAFNWPRPSSTIGDTNGSVVLVSKLDRSGNPLYATTIGGANVTGLALDSAGNLFTYGGADGKAFATTQGAFNGSAGVTGGDFVCKLRASDGSILFCSLPGTDGNESGGFTVDSLGNAYFAEVPVSRYADPTQGALAIGTRACQVTKLDPVGALIYRAEFSGLTGIAQPSSIAADGQGNVWIAGNASGDFPTTPDALLPAPAKNVGFLPGFLAKLNSSGTALLYSTFTDPWLLEQIVLDRAGNIYESALAATGTAILRKYNPIGTAVVYERTFSDLTPGLGGLPFIIDDAGVATALARTTSVNFPTYRPVQACSSEEPSGNWVMLRIDAAGELIEVTFLPIPIAYPSLSEMAANGYFLISSTATENQALGSYQLAIGQLAPAFDAEINLACLGNAAALTIAPLTPGEIVGLFGRGLGPASPVSAQPGNDRFPIMLAGTQVTFDGVPAPLLYVSDSQINAILPWGSAGKPTTSVCVLFQERSTNCVSLEVAGAAPGVFQLPTGYAAVVNQDGTINSPQNPAARGSIISLYATGLGPVTPLPVDGSVVGFPTPALLNAVKVWFFGARGNAVFPGDILYAGPAPLEVAGLFQINVRVPSSVLTYSIEVEVDLPDGSSVVTMFPQLPLAID